jgi:hypothetical protein
VARGLAAAGSARPDTTSNADNTPRNIAIAKPSLIRRSLDNES